MALPDVRIAIVACIAAYLFKAHLETMLWRFAIAALALIAAYHIISPLISAGFRSVEERLRKLVEGDLKSIFGPDVPVSVRAFALRFLQIEIKDIKVGNGGEKACKQPHALFIRNLVVDLGGIRDAISMFGRVRKIHAVSLKEVDFFTEGATKE